MSFPTTPFSFEDLPLIIENGHKWISFQEHQEEILKLQGEGKVGFSPNKSLSLEDARLELKYYLRDGWEIRKSFCFSRAVTPAKEAAK
tara:strand:+ start:328 stop:591 length:264 start_codon:yes stop_codon:yes gene_type:complete